MTNETSNELKEISLEENLDHKSENNNIEYTNINQKNEIYHFLINLVNKSDFLRSVTFSIK
jgi:hypothetical protein